MNTLKYPKENTAFFATLKQRVDAYFVQNQIAPYANIQFWLNAALLVALYITMYVLILTTRQIWVLWTAYAIMGALHTSIFLNVFHDAAHGVIFRNRKWNDRLFSLFSFFGTSSYLWKIRHIQSHHTYPNVPGWDSDIQQSDIVRITPIDSYFFLHRYQHYYMPFIYFFYTLYWLMIRDFKDFYKIKWADGKNIHLPHKEFYKMLFAKLSYFAVILILPMIVASLGWQMVLIGFLIKHLAAAVVGVLALVSVHAGEDMEFFFPNKEGYLPLGWSELQFRSAKDFAPKSAFAFFLFGGFNLHVCHHLFPNICHVHYPALTPIIQKVAAEFGLTYKSESLPAALLSHWKFLRNNSHYPLELLEEPM